jgi:hypothetical protein
MIRASLSDEQIPWIDGWGCIASHDAYDVTDALSTSQAKCIYMLKYIFTLLCSRKSLTSEREREREE